jgi:hypothetical protein
MFSLLLIPIIDLTSCVISKIFYPNEKVHHNRRWFFIHTFINGLVTYYNFSDTVLSLTDPSKYALLPMSSGAFFATNIVIFAHVYHMVVFYKELKKDDWLHHLIMIPFNGVSVYILGIKLQSASAFFICGLPGLIDYSLLYMVKMNWIPKSYEKWIYLYITTFIRSPGSVMVSYISLSYLSAIQDRRMLYYCMLLIFLNFWNGQYYMMKSCRDHEKYLNMRST